MTSLHPDDERVMFAEGPLTFADWLERVDQETVKITKSFGRDDFRDWEFADAFENGVEPRRAAIGMLSADGAIGQEFLRLAGIEPEEDW